MFSLQHLVKLPFQLGNRMMINNINIHIAATGNLSSKTVYLYNHHHNNDNDVNRNANNQKRFKRTSARDAPGFIKGLKTPEFMKINGKMEQVKVKLQKKGERKVMPTNSKWAWTIYPLDPNTVLSKPHLQAKTDAIFTKLKPRFISPQELNYELPKHEVPEIAFLGRSNVGKSSLVGKILGQDGIARSSKTPGCTQTINFYAMEGGKHGKLNPPFYLVDLPGYGFAKASSRNQDRWLAITEKYLDDRPKHILRKTFILIDARHGITKIDRDIMQMFSRTGNVYQIVITKADAISYNQLLKVVEDTFDVICGKDYICCSLLLTASSAKKSNGIAEMRKLVVDTATLKEFEKKK